MKRLLTGARARAAAAAAFTTTACSGEQSALDPAGVGAQQVGSLFWWMAGGALVVWAIVVALSLYAMSSRPEAGKRLTSQLIIGGGVVVPTVVLTILLIYGLRIMPPLLAPPPDGSLRVIVRGEQWWWRVRYVEPGQPPVELANEIRLPVGEPAEFVLASSDVVHSFWIPSIAGKMDMIPGRTTRLTLHPTRVGRFRGACAEYCGTSHALMAFPVVVLSKPEFAAWLKAQRQPASEPAGELAERGRARFFANGCSSCHTIRGTPARGRIGPDLTHVGSRLTIGAGTMPNDPAALAKWISKTGAVKPGVHMPAFDMLPREELQALAAYLESLK